MNIKKYQKNEDFFLKKLNIISFVNKLWEDLKLHDKYSVSVDYDEFKNYDPEMIKKDKEKVKKMKEKFKLDNDIEKEFIEKLAKSFEIIIRDQIEMNEWFGENVNVLKTTEYDDIFNGVDAILEFENTNQHLAIAIDITTSKDIILKLEKIKKDIDNCKLTNIKYFKSIFLNFLGEKKHLPKIIISSTQNTVMELGELFLHKKNQKLANHPVQFQILQEIIVQLKTFIVYTEKKLDEAKNTDKEGKYKKIIEIYKDTLKTIEEIYNKKTEKTKDSKIYDEAFDNMLSSLEFVFKIDLKNNFEKEYKNKVKKIVKYK